MSAITPAGIALTVKKFRAADAAALREAARLLETGKMDFVLHWDDDRASPLSPALYARLESRFGEDIYNDGKTLAIFFDEVRLGGARDERVLFCCFAAAMAETGDL